MGLLLFRVRFWEHPPTEDAVRAELLRRVGSTVGLDSFVVKGHIVEVTTDQGPVVSACVLKILLDLGGEEISSTTPRGDRDHAK